MEAKPIPDVDHADLQAVRKFLTSLRDEERGTRPSGQIMAHGGVPIRNGIARARQRSAPKADV